MVRPLVKLHRGAGKMTTIAQISEIKAPPILLDALRARLILLPTIDQVHRNGATGRPGIDCSVRERNFYTFAVESLLDFDLD